MEIQGKIDFIEATQEIGSFTKRRMVVITDGDYPQHIPVEFFGDKTPLLDKFDADDHVSVKVDLRCKPWKNKQGETKYFVNVNGWSITKLQGAVEDIEPEEAEPNFNPEPDDLPF
jgi:hypothetical protein